MSDKLEYEGTIEWIRIDDTEFGNILKTANNFKYQGLDVTIMNKLMLAHGTAAGKSAKEVRNDVFNLCMWITMRGTQIGMGTKAYKSTSSTGQMLINALATVYKIQTQKNPKGNDVITMGRLASTYPHVILEVRFRMIDGGAGEVRVVGTLPDGLPIYLAFPTAGALIPQGNNGLILYGLWLDWAISFDATINTVADSEKVRKYAEIMHRSSPIAENTRKALCNRAITADRMSKQKTALII
jgi:hypothetical protein